MNEMENGPEFDEVLARVMQRVDAPDGFAAKVMERASVEAHVSSFGELRTRHGAPGVVGRGKVIAFPKAPAWMSGAIAAMLVVGCLAGGEVHMRHERERAQATAEFEASVQITNQALEQTRQQLERAGISLDQQ